MNQLPRDKRSLKTRELKLSHIKVRHNLDIGRRKFGVVGEPCQRYRTQIRKHRNKKNWPLVSGLYHALFMPGFIWKFSGNSYANAIPLFSNLPKSSNT